MKKNSVFLFIIAAVLLTGCGVGTNQGQELPAMIEVELKLPDEQLEAGAEVVIETFISQGGEAVDDANEVKIEIEKVGSSDSEILESEHQGEGIYTVKKQFIEDGTYSVTAHVTARDMHDMPTKELVIGNPSPAVKDQTEDVSHEGSDDESEDSSEHGHAGDVVVDLQSGYEIKLNENTELSALIKEKGHPLTNAKISYEIWKEGEEKHEFLDAIEEGNGVYKTNWKFSEQGNYQVNVHINSDSLHEHQLFTVTVK